MASTRIERDGINYVPFRLGLKHPKLSWVILMLGLYGIRHIVGSLGLRGEMLYVQQGNVELCNGILTQTLAEFVAKSENDDAGRPVPIKITIDDLPDDHEFFEAQIEGRKIDFTRFSTQEPELVVTHVAIDYTAKEEQKIVKALTDPLPRIEVPETDDDDDDWGFDEDELGPVMDEDDEGPIIEVEGKISDPEFTADEAPEPVEKPKKVKPEPKEANDPDFDTADDSPHNPAAPLDGTEFLHIDEELSFTDVTFPNTAEPIRMYDIESSTISAMGFKVLKNDPATVTLYVRFKSGSSVYRYNPVNKLDSNECLNLAVRRHRGIQEASVGSFFHHTIRVKAEEGLIKCQRIHEDEKGEQRWVKVLPKAERTKATKERAKKT